MHRNHLTKEETMTQAAETSREAISEVPNPLGMEGIEFIEFATSRPQALGQLLETMGFRPIARHRSREVLLYRQGGLNVIVNAHSRSPSAAMALNEKPEIAAIALRVRDAAAAYRRALDLGAWAVPVQVEVMELNIPSVHGPGASRIYFVDRHREFSIYDVDFTPIPTVDQHPPAIAGLHFFGVVQYIGNERTEDWTDFYGELFGFTALPAEERFGILPKGRILRSPCPAKVGFYLQLIEPEPTVLEVEDNERFQRIGLGTPDVLATVSELRARGVAFVESGKVHSETKGALTQTSLGSVSFELVHDVRS
jgi:4-hydroxyphenylpyruvate dioxygenase